MNARCWIIAALLLATAAPVVAQPGSAPDCAPEADRLRAHLVQAERSTFRWNLGWTLAFGAASAGQLTLALTETNPLGDFNSKFRDTAYVGAAKAGIGFLSRIVMPLGTDVPARSEDRCVELTSLRASLTRLARKERRLFWLTHLGGTALNLAGAAILWNQHDFKTGAVSFVISYPVGLLSAYTLPRKSWKLWRADSAQWTVTATTGEQPMLSLGGTW